MKYPNMVYKCPGEHQCAGGTYSFKSVNSDEELAELKAEGWKETLFEAIGFDKIPNKSEYSCEKKEDFNPTREEIEQKCTELGIKFDGRNSDVNLLKKIEEKLNVVD